MFFVVQHDNKTPMGRSFASFFIRGIPGADGLSIRCNLSGAASGRLLEVPEWMFDRSLSARWLTMLIPHVEPANIFALARLLEEAGSSQDAKITAAFELAIGSLDVDTAFQEDMHATIAVPHMGLADLTNTTFQTGLIGTAKGVVVGRPIEVQRSTGTPDRNHPIAAHALHHLSLPSRP
jgi:hypothetical protein